MTHTFISSTSPLLKTMHPPPQGPLMGDSCMISNDLLCPLITSMPSEFIRMFICSADDGQADAMMSVCTS